MSFASCSQSLCFRKCVFPSIRCHPAQRSVMASGLVLLCWLWVELRPHQWCNTSGWAQVAINQTCRIISLSLSCYGLPTDIIISFYIVFHINSFTQTYRQTLPTYWWLIYLGMEYNNQLYGEALLIPLHLCLSRSRASTKLTSTVLYQEVHLSRISVLGLIIPSLSINTSKKLPRSHFTT